ncbi:spore cortex biosynthesis protein YabQ [Metabacillus idriensis]|uniref:spore cortex biosynthesis protein YabQ n=1 Tax=Metabacillus idriensis TaxID=324768 RepID=UPI00174A48B5|nr:spore cortex biosynthesis protein YabQ [Metabacillus idriensis]
MTLSTQILTMLSMIGSGCFIGASLDTYGRFLMRPKRAKWVVFINDILFWLVQGLLLFYVLLSVNEGEFRIYILLALVCGFAAYQCLIKGVYLALLEFLIKCVVTVYKTILKMGNFFLIKPIIAIFKITITMISGLVIFLWNLLKWIAKLVFLIVKIVLTPLFWILKGMWRFVPASIRNFFYRFFKKIAGFYEKIKNMSGNLWISWKKKK